MNYIEYAKSVAKDRKKSQVEKDSEEKALRRYRLEQIATLMTLLKSCLRQFDGQAGLSYQDDGDYDHVPCAYLLKGGKPYISFQCHWQEFRDEEGTVSAPEIVVTYCQENVREWDSLYHRYHTNRKKESFLFPCDDSTKVVDNCMVAVATYLSKLF